MVVGAIVIAVSAAFGCATEVFPWSGLISVGPRALRNNDETLVETYDGRPAEQVGAVARPFHFRRRVCQEPVGLRHKLRADL